MQPAKNVFKKSSLQNNFYDKLFPLTKKVACYKYNFYCTFLKFFNYHVYHSV